MGAVQSHTFKTNQFSTMKSKLTLIGFLFLLTVALFGQEDPGKWTPKDIINTEYMQSVVISPDNQLVAWTKRKGVKEKDKFVSDIYLTRLDTEKDGSFRTFQLTNQDENDYAPFFSPDSETLYFLSSRDKGKKLWAMSLYGGEPKEVHEFANGISNPQWLNDSTFAFVSNDGKTLRDEELKKKKDNTVVVEDSVHWTKNRIYAFDVKKKTIRRLTDNRYPVSSYRASTNGEWIVYQLTLSRHYASDAHPHPAYYIKNLKTGKTHQILQGLQTPGGFRFTADNAGFYFSPELSSDPEWVGSGINELYYFDLASMQQTKVDLDWDWGLGGGFRLAGNHVVASLANGATRKLALYAKAGDSWTKSEIDLGTKNDHVSVLAISEDGEKIVYDHSTGGQLPKYYIADLGRGQAGISFNNERELAKVNKKLGKKRITKHEVVYWKGYNDDEVNGILYYPENYEEGKKYPLVLSIHGGPSGVDLDSWRERWSTYPQIIAQRGAFVLKPNYHGSSNHGLEFVESIKKNYYTPELADITKGIEVLNEKGMIDMDQLGVMGWSNGAILATMLTVRYPDMFKVACPGAGDVNWTSDFGTCRFGVRFDQSYFGGTPWDDVDGKFYNEKYIEYSPLFEMEKVKTPTIIFHGSEDRAVPRDQGWEYYRALQQAGQTPVRFLWFPGQPHGLQKITHQLRKMNEELAWIDHFLFKKEDKKNEAFKKDSPLAMLISRDKVAKNGGFYGKMENGVLFPETVAIKKDSLEVGRFEVTNAQFREFHPEFRFDKGRDNHPAKVTLNQAKEYIMWLNERTGQQYRLPSTAEAKKWHKTIHKTAAKENTLNYWAGYAITKDEVPMLQSKLKEAQSTLIREVGSFKSTKVGEAELYDLGGNVAEYAEDGKTYGYSAYDYVDPNAEEPVSDSANIGFRVVKGK